MSEQSRNTGLLVVVLFFVGLAVVTLVPASLPRANDLGYTSACPFAPWSTLALLFVAGVFWVTRSYLREQVKR